ncbi:DUF2391 domain-containing protein [Halostella sp. PRR32]|uniref:DUF2391 domain-containing protein n=1 Tax=Halostella sp. PRR32 TaxID=3098147 RepID=UPI002B1D8738|nr:DUF2391 domain-containing protein [Halostella sp. PRR32]
MDGEPSPDIDDLLDELEDLEESVDSTSEREQVRETMRMARRVDTGSGVFGNVIKGFDRGDAAEALVGSVVFGIPMLVEGGTLEVGEFIATHPAYLAGTLTFGVAIVIGILYVADIQDVRVHEPLFGLIPRRLVGVVGIASVTAVVAMTAWGRVDWSDPHVAASQVTVCFVAMAIGGALGDILPGS